MRKIFWFVLETFFFGGRFRIYLGVEDEKVAALDDPTLLGTASSFVRGRNPEGFPLWQVVLTFRGADPDNLEPVFFELSTTPAGTLNYR